MGVYLWVDQQKREPWANTVAYRPLESDAKDHSGNWYNLGLTYDTSTWRITYMTRLGVQCAYSPWKAYFYSNTAALPSGWNARTVSLWYSGSSGSWQESLLAYWNVGGSGAWFDIYLYNWWVRFSDVANPVSTGITPASNTWTLVTITYDATNHTRVYVNGEQKGTNSTTRTTNSVSASYPFRLFARNDSTNYTFSWYLSNVIVENVARTAEKVAEYYNLMKPFYSS